MSKIVHYVSSPTCTRVRIYNVQKPMKCSATYILWGGNEEKTHTHLNLFGISEYTLRRVLSVVTYWPRKYEIHSQVHRCLSQPRWTGTEEAVRLLVHLPQYPKPQTSSGFPGLLTNIFSSSFWTYQELYLGSTCET